MTEGACDTATALLKVMYNKPEGNELKKKFAVCVKGLDMPDDLSLRLAEWIELLIAMGADKVFIYSYQVAASFHFNNFHYKWHTPGASQSG